MTEGRDGWTGYGSTDVWIVYTNWKGGTERRHIEPHALWYGASTWHPGRQWLLGAWDLERNKPRTFALSGIRAWAATAEALPEDAPALLRAARAATGATEGKEQR